MIRRFLIVVGRFIKGDTFSIDAAVPLGGIIGFGVQRLAQSLRFQIWRWRLADGSGSFGFVSRGVSIHNSRQLRLGAGVTLGNGVYIQCLSKYGISIGPGSSVGAHSRIVATSVMRNLGEGCSIGSHCGIGEFGYVGCSGRVTIGDDVIMGQYVSFHSENHAFSDLDRPIRSQGVVPGPIVVESDCWIGAKVTFLAGATLGRGSVVAAGAVVRGVIPPGSIVAGVPGRIIGSRLAGKRLTPLDNGAAGPEGAL